MIYNLEYFKNIIPKRPQDAHKGTFGHVLNIAGSNFYSGAAYFSSIAPLMVGCGKVTLLSAETVLRTVSALSPDIILMPLNKFKKEKINDFQAISIGCGLSQDEASVKLFKGIINIFTDENMPIVIDADGLNILSAMKIKLPINTILTPHPRELSRLMETEIGNILSEPEFWAQKCCEKYNCTTVLKLHKTIISNCENEIYINNTGNTALAHGGSGDVLCGMIAGLLAQGLNCFEASCLAVYLHGLAGEFASEILTEYSVLASDLINYIPKAIKTIL